MKILMISTMDTGGGAAIAANRLCEELNSAGVNTVLYVGSKRTNKDYVQKLPYKKFRYLYLLFQKIENCVINLCFRTTNHILHSASFFSGYDVSWINESDYDIVNLHWINGALSIKDISRINKPIIWTLHDSWPCCGAEHHPNVLEKDNRWKIGYYKNNKPASTHGLDVCRLVWQQKKKYLKKKNISFIAPSKWEMGILKNSALFSDNRCEVIPNILPFSVFYPREREKTRNKYGIPLNSQCIGFGTAYRIDNPKSMKGIRYLIEALELMKNKNGEVFLVLMGPVSAEFVRKLPFNCFAPGYISDDNLLADLYSCCDCFVNSSLIENLGYTTFESLACGTPVVAFDVGGMGDLIIHKKNGYLVKPYDTTDLEKGILCCMNAKKSQEEISKGIQDKFSVNKIIDKTIDYYEEVLNNA